MKFGSMLAGWLDIRPGEGRPAALACGGSFLVLAFLTLARSMREAIFLTTFPVSHLPYITAATVVAGLPAVSVFTTQIANRDPRRVLVICGLGMGGGLAAIRLLLGLTPTAAVAFYLWTSVGVMLLTSGFWVLTSEVFAVRGAKRLYALIGAGGTAGAMATGGALTGLIGVIEADRLLAALLTLLALFLASQHLQRPAGCAAASRRDLTPPPDPPVAARIRVGNANRESLRLVAGSRHLRLIALIVLFATTASTLVDYQFKEIASAAVTDQAELTGFLGAFYGWTGAVALAIQLLFSARMMATSGIAISLAVLPAFLLAGSLGLLLAPGLAVAAGLRGADNSLRKSVFRPVVEYLFVPLPSELRRRTKTFIDTTVDGVAEGLGAVIVFLWVTLGGLPSRWLSLPVILFAVVMFRLSRSMGREYFATIVERLRAPDREPELAADGHQKDLLSATFTRMDVRTILSGVRTAVPAGRKAERKPEPAAEPTEPDLLRSADDRVVSRTIDAISEWDAERMEALVRLLARDGLTRRVVAALAALGEKAVPILTSTLLDEGADFVIRRRIPSVLAETGGEEAEEALLRALSAGRFEVRYKAAVALVRRDRDGLPRSRRDRESRIWDAVRAEVKRDRPIWELQSILDRSDVPEDELVAARVGVRGELSLEHTFRMMTLVLDPEPVRAAFAGVVRSDERLKGFALEYLDQALPPDIRRRLWLFIGDVGEYARRKQTRTLGQVAGDLMETRATLFAGGDEREALRRMLENDRRRPEEED